MRITIIGTSYVGLVTGACFAQVGNHVLCVDLDAEKIDVLNNGGMPIHEPGLEEMVNANRAAGRLGFTTDIAESVDHGDVQFITVGTPPNDDGSADLRHVLAAARNIGRHMESRKFVVNKSTVPVGTADRVEKVIQEKLGARDLDIPFSVISNPEFLKVGAAVEDFMRASRIIIGADNSEAIDVMRQLYAPINRHHEKFIVMDTRSAELTKYAANAMLATRISFMNEMANLAEKVGADIENIRRGIGSDPRIGYDFLYAGCGYGGSCFPKDMQALLHAARTTDGTDLKIIEAAHQANEHQKRVLSRKIRKAFGENLDGRHFAVWGLAFKPNTDDIRESGGLTLIKDLLEAGATVAAYDPAAIDLARKFFKGEDRIQFGDDPMAVLDNADALAIATEWTEFRSPDFDAMKQKLKQALIFDGRNLYDPIRMRGLGIEYHGIGRARLH